ncbi:MAG: NusG domain II-containing protein [Tyzzerella sp.]|nr:NusG domain II-containing protein [Tyzzerella sp.]
MKLKKMDLILILVVVALAIGGMLIYRGFGAKEAGTVIVEVDGEAFGEYSLDENHEILINDTNVLIIENGQANMYEANCPDQICVKHKPISKNGETIVCLPNKVVVTITEAEKSELDAVID